MLCGCSSKRQWSGSHSLQPYGPAPAVEEGQEGQAVTEQVTSTWNHRPGRNSASRAGNRLHCTAGPTRQPAPPPLPAPGRAPGLRSRRRGARCLGVGGLQVLALSPHRTARAPLPGGRTLVPRFTLRARYSKCFRREHGQSPPWREDGGAHLSLRKLTRGTLKKLAEGDGGNKCEFGLQPTLRAGPALFSLQSCPGVL